MTRVLVDYALQTYDLHYQGEQSIELPVLMYSFFLSESNGFRIPECDWNNLAEEPILMKINVNY